MIFLDVIATAILTYWWVAAFLSAGPTGADIFLPPVLICIIWSHRIEKIRENKRRKKAEESDVQDES